MLFPHHDSSPECPGCKARTDQAHPDLAEWFWSDVKPKHADAHVCWSFRDKSSQDDAFQNGKSKDVFPMSPHNHSDAQGNPCALALDLFQINAENPNGLWSTSWCELVWNEIQARGRKIVWGGNFRTFKDSDHFQHSGFRRSGSEWIPIADASQPLPQ